MQRLLALMKLLPNNGSETFPTTKSHWVEKIAGEDDLKEAMGMLFTNSKGVTDETEPAWGEEQGPGIMLTEAPVSTKNLTLEIWF